MNDNNQQDIPEQKNQIQINDENDGMKANEIISNENMDDKQIALIDTKDKSSSRVLKYTVQDGESLHNISKKFSISKELIKSSNRLSSHHVHPGDTLKIYLGIEPLDDIDPIEVIRYDKDGKTSHIKGKLFIKDYELAFHPNSIIHQKIKISIFGHLETAIVQNPSSIYFQSLESHHHHHSSMNFKSSDDQENLSVLSIEYLNEDDILMTDYFIGPKDDIEKFQNKLDKISSMTKRTPELYNPDKRNIEIPHPVIKTRPHHNSFSFHMVKKMNQDNSENKSDGVPLKITLQEETLLDISINGKSNIFNEEDILQFRKYLPKLYRNSNWNCLFQTRIHGFSLSTLFSRTAKKSPLLLFIKTMDNEVIGGFLYNGLIISDKYYGNYETFVFRMKPNIEVFHWDIRKPKSNRYFVSSNLSCISFGASSEQGGGSALFIQNDLNTGFSEDCDTYSSPQLTKTKKFLIDELEIWYIGII